MIPDWQLPPGTDRGSWDYMQSERLAREYDEALAGTPLLQADLAFVARHCPTLGRLVDLGCGTGRLCLNMATQGYACVGVDLSAAMLDVLRAKADATNLPIERVQANLVELDALPTASFDYAACLFSTLGMLRGVTARTTFLAHVRRVLKPGGVFIVHAHNARYHFGVGLGKRGAERGDHTMPQHRGGADLTLHHFTRRELLTALQTAGFRVKELTRVVATTTAPLRHPWFFGDVRAYGFLVAAE